MKNYIFSILIFILVSFASTGCKTQDTTSARNDITVSQLKEQMKADTNLVILDVRTKEELTGKLPKIKSAINIPLQELEKKMDELKQYKDKKIAVICRSGHRSSEAYVILKKHGYNVENVLGGMQAYLGK